MNQIENGYTDKFIDHFLNPRNIGEIEDADGQAKVGDPQCGDYIKVWLKIEANRIIDYKYKVFGCGGAIATTSAVSELAIGKSLNEAIDLTDDDVIKALGGIPENKAHCSLLGIQGLRTALADYFVKQNHQRYQERIELYRKHGYDIPKARDDLVKKLDALSGVARILDLGTGKGHLALALGRAGYSCISVDISDQELHYARMNALYHHFDELIEFQKQDATRLSFETGAFDAVVTADMIHHLPDPEPMLREMLRICRPDGQIIISDFNQKGFNIMDQVHQAEGRSHPVTGWEMKAVAEWFKREGYQVQTYNEVCEVILVIRKKG